MENTTAIAETIVLPQRTIACPRCRAPLVARDAGGARYLRCSACGQRFPAGGLAGSPRTSRKAIAGLVLGVCSLGLLWLTGLPAVILGWLALRDIRHRPEELRGAGLAWAGLAMGAVFGLGLGSCVSCLAGSIGTVAATFVVSNEPDKVRAIAAEIGDFTPPAGLEPEFGMDMLIGMRHVVYIRKAPKALPDAFADLRKRAIEALVVLRYPSLGATAPVQVEIQARGMIDPLIPIVVQSTETFTCDSGSHEISVKEDTGKLRRDRPPDADSPPAPIGVRRYTAQIPTERGLLFVVAAVVDLPAEATADSGQPAPTLSRADMCRFLSSFRPK